MALLILVKLADDDFTNSDFDKSKTSGYKMLDHPSRSSVSGSNRGRPRLDEEFEGGVRSTA